MTGTVSALAARRASGVRRGQVYWIDIPNVGRRPWLVGSANGINQTAAVTHVDGTSRVQTVSAEQNPYLYRILDAFERRTGVPVLINTSFNLRGEPIVTTPDNAMNTFFASGLDTLVLGNFVVRKDGTD